MASARTAPPSNSRISQTDQASGIVTLTIRDDFGENEDLDHGLITGATAEERWNIHPDDPLSARGHTRWSETLRRGEWQVRTETTARDEI